MNTAEMAREWLVGLEVLSSYAIIESDSTDPCVVESLTALLASVREEERERCAKIAEDDAELTKHTRHDDGLGMGCQRMELVANRIAAAIRKGE